MEKGSAVSRKAKKPQWWQLYVMLPVLAALFVLEIRLGLKGAANIIAQLAILFLVYSFMQLWTRANHRALMGLDEERGEWQFKVYEITSADLARARAAAQRAEPRPLFHLPEREVKGVLSTTFEIDDSESHAGIPVDSEALYSREARINEREQSQGESERAAIPQFVRKE